MEGEQKNNFNSEEIREKIKKLFLKKKRFFILKDKKEKTVKELLLEEKNKKKKRSFFIKKSEELEKKLVVFLKKEADLRKQKKEIEALERKEKEVNKRREIEKERWQTEEKRREIEKERWQTEDKIKLLKEEKREIEKEITEKIRPSLKKTKEVLEKINNLTEKISQREEFLKKELVNQKKKEEETREQKKREEEKRQKEEEEKEIEALERKKRDDARKETEKTKEEAERTKEIKEEEIKKREGLKEGETKNAEDEVARKKIEEVFSEIEKNKREIDRLREELKKKENNYKERDIEENKNDEKKQIDLIREKIREEEEREEEKRDGGISNEKIERVVKEEVGEKRQIDFIRERVREEQEKLQKIQKSTTRDNFNNNLQYSTPTREEEDLQAGQSNNEFSRFSPQEKKEEFLDKENKIKMEEKEAEALFQKAEQSFYAGNLPTAKSRFNRIAQNYTPEENKGAVFGAIKTKPLNERASNYLEKISQEESRGRNLPSKEYAEFEEEKKKEERKEIERCIQDVLTRRRGVVERKKEAEKNNINEDLIKSIEVEFQDIEKEREALERKLGEVIVEIEDDKERRYSTPVTIIREVVRERGDDKIKEEIREELKKEIDEIKREKERLTKIEEIAKKEREKERTEWEKKIKEEEKKIEIEKEKLDKKEGEAQTEEEKEEIRRKKKEMEEELRRLIKEETEGKWGKKISEIEKKVAETNKKYKDLTEKERGLREKIKEIESWGPEGRRKKEEPYEYRSLYRTFPQKEEDVEVVVSEVKHRGKMKNIFYKIKIFFSLLKPSKDFFLKPPVMIGVDISDYSVEVFSLNEQRLASSYGRSVLEEGVVYNGDIRDREKLKKSFLEIFASAKPNPIKIEKDRRIKAVVSLPESKVFIQQLKLTNGDSILEKVKEEIKNKIPIPIEDLYFFYQTISFVNKREKLVLCIIVEKKTVKEYIDFFRFLDIDPVVFDLEGVALGRAVLPEEPKEKEKKLIGEMIVDVGARATTISIFCNKELSFSVGIPFGGAYFTESIAKKLSISKEDAEKKKKSLGVEGEIKEVLSDCLEKITEEIKDAEKYYEGMADIKIKNIFITGGSVMIPGAVDYFKKLLGGKIIKGDVLQKIKLNTDEDKREMSLYANAIGLALRSLNKDFIEDGFNLLPEEVKKQEKRHERERRSGVKITAVLIVILGSLLLLFALYYAYMGFFGAEKIIENTEEEVIDYNQKENIIDTSYQTENQQTNNENKITENTEVVVDVVVEENKEEKLEEAEVIIREEEWSSPIETEIKNNGEDIFVKEEGAINKLEKNISEAIFVYDRPNGNIIKTTIYPEEEYLVLYSVLDWLFVEAKNQKGWIKKSIDEKK